MSTRKIAHHVADHWEQRGYITTADVAKRGEVSFRQIDHWCRQGYIQPALPASGSGSRRMFTRTTIGQVAAMGRVSRALGVEGRSGTNGAGRHILAAVAEHWWWGRIELAEGVTITWPTEDLDAKMYGHGR